MTAIPRQLLEATWRVTRELTRRVEARPVDWVPWLPLQLRYMRSRSQRRLLRAGNQALGKTTASLADLLLDALGEHPFRPADEHGEYWVICAAWSQSVAIQGKLHALIPPDRLHPSTVFTELRGYRGKNPAVEVRHKDGSYSIIRFKTVNQGTLNLAGATIRGALFDEPPAQEVYSEVAKRVQSTGGWVSIAMTPIGAPVDWVRDLVEQGLIEDIHVPLTPDALIPEGHHTPRRLPDGTVCDAAWISRVEADTPAHEVPVRVHGEWEVRQSERYFSAFVSAVDAPGTHVTVVEPAGEQRVLLGIDHGSAPGKQTALLMLVAEPTPDAAQVYVLDEYSDPTGRATPADDARGIVEMLARNGLKWHQLDHVMGDRVHMPGSAGQKSNRDLQVHIARHLGLTADQLHPPVRTAKRGRGRGAGSVAAGCRWLHHQQVRPGGFRVHPRCTKLIEALDRYLGPYSRDDKWTDPIDALRYGLDEYIFRTRRGPAGVVRFG